MGHGALNLLQGLGYSDHSSASTEPGTQITGGSVRDRVRAETSPRVRWASPCEHVTVFGRVPTGPGRSPAELGVG